MRTELELTRHWQEIFGRVPGGRHVPSDKPRVIDQDLAEIRVKFIIEELTEYLDANQRGDLVDLLDALGDIAFFLFGQTVIHGMDPYLKDAFRIIWESNMSKMGEDGKPVLREDGKILKGPGYWEPTEQLTQLLDGTHLIQRPDEGPSYAETIMHG